MSPVVWSSPRSHREQSVSPDSSSRMFLTLSEVGYESNVRYAQTAENVGFEYALSQIRFMAGYGAVSVHFINHILVLISVNRKTNTSPSLSPKLSSITPRSSTSSLLCSQGHGTQLSQPSKSPVSATTQTAASQSTLCQAGSRQSSPASANGGSSTLSGIGMCTLDPSYDLLISS